MYGSKGVTTVVAISVDLCHGLFGGLSMEIGLFLFHSAKEKNAEKQRGAIPNLTSLQRKVKAPQIVPANRTHGKGTERVEKTEMSRE